MTAYQYIQNHVYTKLQPSNIQGIGVFAIRDIEPDTELFVDWVRWSGFYVIKHDEFLQLPKSIQTHIDDIFSPHPEFPKVQDRVVQLKWGCHWVYTTPYYFVNSGFENANIDKETMKSTRFIYKGEEILSDYSKKDRMPKKPLI